MHSTPGPLRLNSPTELLSAIPYLFGYHPTDSVMCLAVRRDRTPFLVNTPLPLFTADGSDAAAAEAAALTADAADTAVIVGYGTSARIDAVVALFHTALTAVGVRVPVVLRTSDGRYFCLTPGCGTCPADGTAYDPGTSLAAARSVAMGWVALPNRAAVVAQLDPLQGRRRVRMDAACRSAAHRLRGMLRDSAGDGFGHGLGHPVGGWTAPGRQAAPVRVVEAGTAALHDALDAAAHGRVLDDDEVGWLAVVLRIAAVEVVAWQLNTYDTWQRQLWTDVVRRATPALTAVPACLLASTAY